MITVVSFWSYQPPMLAPAASNPPIAPSENQPEKFSHSVVSVTSTVGSSVVRFVAWARPMPAKTISKINILLLESLATLSVLRMIDQSL